MPFELTLNDLEAAYAKAKEQVGFSVNGKNPLTPSLYL